MALVVARGAFNVVVNSLAAYGFTSFFEKEEAKDMAIIIAIDTTFRIATMHLLTAFFGNRVEKAGEMAHLAFITTTAVIQPISAYLAHKLCKAKVESHSTLFGYIALSWKANMMIKDILIMSGFKNSHA